MLPQSAWVVACPSNENRRGKTVTCRLCCINRSPESKPTTNTRVFYEDIGYKTLQKSYKNHKKEHNFDTSL